MATRTIIKCKDCGLINDVWTKTRRSDIKCPHCKSESYEEVECPDMTEAEKKEYGFRDLREIFDVALRKIQPKKEDYFGCIEMCDYLKEEYGLTDEIYELAGYINDVLPILGHKCCERHPVYPYDTELGIKLSDGRFVIYSSMVYYSREIAFENDTLKDDREPEEIKKVLLEKIDTVRRLKSFTYGNHISMLGEIKDHDFDLETIKKARLAAIEYLEVKYKKEKEKQEAAEWKAKREQIVEELTKPVQITDPNYVKEATCPNCHKNTVYRISTTKRAASIGLFGLLSKNIGKTMECKHCGHRW